LKIDEQIAHMRDVKGIKFTIIDEEQATEFIRKHTYYFKLKAFAKNYEKYNSGDKIDQYIDLEFAYIAELSKLDAYFRKIIIRMVLDVEHFLKVQLLRDISESEDEDGYVIVEKFKQNYPRVFEQIADKAHNPYCRALIEKYKADFAVWNLVEVLSFGEFIELYSYYYCYHREPVKVASMLRSIKWLRNAAAHNNCLFDKIAKPYESISASKELMTRIARIRNLPQKTRESKMKNPVIHDFVALLYVFDKIVPPSTAKELVYKELSDLVNIRFVRYKQYFERNDAITSSYNFLKIVVDFYTKHAYNINVEQKSAYHSSV